MRRGCHVTRYTDLLPLGRPSNKLSTGGRVGLQILDKWGHSGASTVTWSHGVPTKTIHDVGLMLVQRLRRWANIKPTSGRCLASPYTPFVIKLDAPWRNDTESLVFSKIELVLAAHLAARLLLLKYLVYVST